MVRGPKILGLDVWHERTPVSFLGTEWAANPVVRQSDIRVDAFLDSVGGQRYAARRDELLQLLEVDPQWHLSKISDGEKRRTQLVMGLMQPWEVLLLDEVTVDLDALSRSRLMDYLRRETETRQATVLYATHITQQMDGWPTHVSRMSLGRSEGQMRWPLEADAVSASLQTRLDDPASELSLYWLLQDAEERKELERKGLLRRRGPTQAVVKDAKAFFEAYDYTH